MLDPDRADDRPEVKALLQNLKRSLPDLEELLASCGDHWGYEDPVYRFYHQSFKVYALQESTRRIADKLQEMAPERELNSYFLSIIRDGTGKVFTPEHNRDWLAVTRPILEAFFHARYFLEMAVKYGRELSSPPSLLPSGWAALLYLYNLR
jgi:hypothetical protein